MESSCGVSCNRCRRPYNRLPPEEQDADALYEKVWCPRCESYPFLIKCGYCSSFVHCSSKRDAAPGMIIVCPNQTCSRHFQYITCPNSACRKPNYHPIDMMMGSVTQCAHCKVQFQSVTCNLCWTENYFKGDEESYYRSGVETTCRGCKGSFIQRRCSLCKTPAYTEATIYGKCKEVRCDHCAMNLRQTICPACKKLNRNYTNELEFGTLEQCGCGATYRTHICDSCGEIEHQITSLSQNNDKAVVYICKKCSKHTWQVDCIKCEVPCFLPGDPFMDRPNLMKCLRCQETFTINFFKCTDCNRTHSDYKQITSCPFRSFNDLREPLQIPEHLLPNIRSLFTNNSQSTGNQGLLQNLQSPSSNSNLFHNLQNSFPNSDLFSGPLLPSLRRAPSSGGGIYFDDQQSFDQALFNNLQDLLPNDIDDLPDDSLPNLRRAPSSGAGIMLGEQQDPLSNTNSGLFSNLLAPSSNNNGGLLSNVSNPSSRPSGSGFLSLFSNSQAPSSNNTGGLLSNGSNPSSRPSGSGFVGLLSLLGNSQAPSSNNSGILSNFNNSNNVSNQPSGGLFSNLIAPSSTNGSNTSNRPSGGLGGLFSNLQAPSSNNSGRVLSNGSNALNRPSGGFFNNLSSNRPQTDDLTQKINEIKDSDDTPTENEEKRCSICLDNEKRVVYIPCGHLSCCLACTKVIMQKDKECPICKQKITNFQRIYIT